MVRIHNSNLDLRQELLLEVIAEAVRKFSKRPLYNFIGRFRPTKGSMAFHRRNINLLKLIIKGRK